MKYDLHIHSKYSYNGILEPKDILKIAIKRGSDGIAITDHNTVKGALEAKNEYDQISNMIRGAVKSAVYIASPTTIYLFVLLLIYYEGKRQGRR